MRLPDRRQCRQALKPVDLRQSCSRYRQTASRAGDAVVGMSGRPLGCPTRPWPKCGRNMSGPEGGRFARPPAGPFDLRATPTSDGKNELPGCGRISKAASAIHHTARWPGSGAVTARSAAAIIGRPLFQGISFTTRRSSRCRNAFRRYVSKSGKHTYTVSPSTERDTSVPTA